MISYGLPTSVEVDGKEYAINNKGDYRTIIDLIYALNDENLLSRERCFITLAIFYGENIPDNTQEAINKMLWFVSNGEETEDKPDRPQLMDWDKDFKLYIAPMNKTYGAEIRLLDYLHWWSFLSVYMEIDSKSTFAMVIDIRRKLHEGKKLDSTDEKFYRENYDLINISKLSNDDKEWLMGVE